jgi:hypothetical protein
MAMHECAKQVIAQLQSIQNDEPESENPPIYEREYMLLVD